MREKVVVADCGRAGRGEGERGRCVEMGMLRRPCECVCVYMSVLPSRGTLRRLQPFTPFTDEVSCVMHLLELAHITPHGFLSLLFAVAARLGELQAVSVTLVFPCFSFAIFFGIVSIFVFYKYFMQPSYSQVHTECIINSDTFMIPKAIAKTQN